MVNTPSDSPAPADTNKEPEKPKGKPWQPVMVTRDGAYLVRGGDNYGTPTDRYFLPWVDSSDPRQFMKKGQLIKPFGIVVFVFDGIHPCPNLPRDEARYHEIVRSDFDPTDCVQVGAFNLEAHADELNTAYQKNQQVPPSVTALQALGSVPAANDSAPPDAAAPSAPAPEQPPASAPAPADAAPASDSAPEGVAASA